MDQIIFQHSAVDEGLHLVMQFDVSHLASAVRQYPRIAKEVDEQFAFVNLNMVLSKEELYRNIHSNLQRYPGLCLPSNVSSILHSKFYIRNHMFSVDIEIVKDGTRSKVNIPVDKLYLYTECAYFSSERTPSMILFVNNSTSTGIFTRGGKMNLVGGYTQFEVKYALIMFLGRIEDGIRRYYKSDDVAVSLVHICLENYVVSSRLPYSSIDTYHAAVYAVDKHIPKSYVPEYCNLLNIRPFTEAAPSVHIRIFPTGGVIITGCRSLFEISIAVQFLAAVIEKYIRSKNSLEANGEVLLAQWQRDERAKMYKKELMKLKQMQKKRAKWIKQKQAKIKLEGLAPFKHESEWEFDAASLPGSCKRQRLLPVSGFALPLVRSSSDQGENEDGDEESDLDELDELNRLERGEEEEEEDDEEGEEEDES